MDKLLSRLVDSNSIALSTVCDEINHGEDVSELANAMIKVMRSKAGVGLAAPQIGVCKRVIAIEYAALNIVMINPVIVKSPGKIVKSINEGCLSFPALLKTIKRSKRVVVEGYDLNWNKVKIDARNMAAFIFQHEIDHLNGITIARDRK